MCRKVLGNIKGLQDPYRNPKTQKEFADKVGMKQSVISRLESADYRGYRVETLERIAQAMNQELHFHFVSEQAHCAFA